MKFDDDRLDEYGLPMPVIHFNYGDNEFRIFYDMESEAGLILKGAGFEDVVIFNTGLNIFFLSTYR